jgi:hypothetical protein
VSALEFLERGLHFASAAAHRARYPVERTQSVEHGSANARHREGLEFHTPLGIEALDGIDEAKHAGTDQVARIDTVGQARANTAGNELDEWRVMHDETIAGHRVSAIEPALPAVIEVEFASHARGWASA